MRLNGVILYRGFSRLNHERIVVIATGLARRSANAKTGDLVQLWILPADDSPVDAVRSGADASVCGDCPHRPFTGGKCYVNVGQAPLAVYRTFRNGRYPVATPGMVRELFKGRLVRFGAWGDPAAVPVHVLRMVHRVAREVVGYTHAWRYCDPAHRAWAMASCDSPADREEAIARGWKTFRVRSAADALLTGEFSCPASIEEGKRTSCASCLACNGGTYSGRATPSIISHGFRESRRRPLAMA